MARVAMIYQYVVVHYVLECATQECAWDGVSYQEAMGKSARQGNRCEISHVRATKPEIRDAGTT